MVRFVGVLMLVFILGPVFSGDPSDYRSVHFSSIVADGHNDVLLRVMAGEDISVRTKSGHTDLVRLKEGGINFQWFSVWVSPTFLPNRAFKRANAMIDSLEEIVRRNPDEIAIVRNYDEAMKSIEKGKIAAAIGMEGAHPLEDSIEKMVHFYNRGIRYIAPTWNNSIGWASSAHDETNNPKSLKQKGLTDLGREMIRKMDELGILIDISHAGRQTVKDILETTTNPVIASHSGVHALAPHFRNLTDEQIKAVAERGGVICVIFYPGFLDLSFERAYQNLLKSKEAEVQRLRDAYANDHEYWNARADLIQPHIEKIRPPIDLVVKHIDHIVQVAGIEHVGIGSDYDGVSVLPVGLEDVSSMPNLTKALIERGYSEEDVRKILGENMMRVFKRVAR
jgi:membrane dipeptidase